MNGKPGDHPITDILKYGLEVYGTEADELIRRIGRLSSREEMYDWWDAEIGWSAGAESILQKVRQRHSELVRRAQESGWELPNEEK